MAVCALIHLHKCAKGDMYCTRTQVRTLCGRWAAPGPAKWNREKYLTHGLSLALIQGRRRKKDLRRSPPCCFVPNAMIMYSDTRTWKILMSLSRHRKFWFMVIIRMLISSDVCVAYTPVLISLYKISHRCLKQLRFIAFYRSRLSCVWPPPRRKVFHQDVSFCLASRANSYPRSYLRNKTFNIRNRYPTLSSDI